MFRTIITKFYQNQPGFIGDVTKTFGVFWGSHFAVPIAVQLQNANAKFHKKVV